MVAYSFKQRFVAPILAGTKRQTIRADRKRHARPGEEVQLYTGMRTKQRKLIGRAIVEKVVPVTLRFCDPTDGSPGVEGVTWHWPGDPRFTSPVWMADLNRFAREDGFKNWGDLKAFWAMEHGVDEFAGVLITWGPLQYGIPAAPPAKSRKLNISPAFDAALGRRAAGYERRR